MTDFDIDTSAANYAEELALLGVTGAMYYSQKGTQMPERIDALNPPHVDLGWLSDGGITESLNEERSDWTPFQSTNPIRGQVTKQDFQFKTVVWSISGLANALYYGVPESAMKFNEQTGVTTFEQGKELPPDFKFGLVVDIVDGAKARRHCMPNVSVVERGDIVYSKGDLVGYEMTFRASYDPETNYSVRRMFKEGWKPGHAGTTLTDENKDASLGDWSNTLDESEARKQSKTVTLPKGATGGTFTVSINGKASAAINHDATGTAMKLVLNKVDGGESAKVTGRAGGPYTITGVEGEITADGTNLTGSDTQDISIN
ncbi:phage tail protein [Corynebacterium ulcerans]|uniref:phage tail tube protein n=1 Tax=Corynebacterium ulcerans TaxID=65058 RepID=UPI0034A267FE